MTMNSLFVGQQTDAGTRDNVGWADYADCNLSAWPALYEVGGGLPASLPAAASLTAASLTAAPRQIGTAGSIYTEPTEVRLPDLAAGDAYTSAGQLQAGPAYVALELQADHIA